MRPMLWWVVALSLALGGCATQSTFDQGRALVEAGDVEAGLAKVQEAAKADPGSYKYQEYYVRQKDIALERYIALAGQARVEGQWDLAEATYRKMLALDPGNPRARAGLATLKADRRHRELLAQAKDLLAKGRLLAAHAKVSEVLFQDANDRQAQRLLRRIEERSVKEAIAAPQLSAALRKPVSIEFRDASLRQIFDVISQQTGLNFIFDRDVRPDLRATVSVRNTSLDDVLRFILVTNQLERKVLNPHTLLIYPNTAAKNREYQDLIVKSFYLTNADVKQTAAMIKTMVKTKDMYVDDKLNLLVIRDTPAAVRMAERLIADQDLAEPEVVLDLEVLEVGTNVLNNLGIQYPDQFAYSVVGKANTPGTVTLPEWLNRGSGLVQLTVTNPFLILNLQNQVGLTNLLANPQIRVKNHEDARIHIGDKVPVITTTTTATGFAAESVQYLDVGLKLDVKPTIYLDDEVGMKVGLEVSNIVREVQTSTGTLTYQLGTRTASTTLRLKDGETQMLAGLISDQDSKSINQIPGIGNIPILGRLFGNHQDTNDKTEIVLLITPHIVRTLARPSVGFEEFPSGTEDAAGAAPLRLESEPPTGAKVSTLSGGPSEASSIGSSGRVTLSAPANVAPGKEFTIGVNLDFTTKLRGGLLDLSFDATNLHFVRAEPGPLIKALPTQVSLRANAPQGSGRLSLKFAAKSAISGSGELARIVFRAADAASGTPTVRLEAVSVTDPSGRLLSGKPPAPLALSLAR